MKIDRAVRPSIVVVPGEALPWGLTASSWASANRSTSE